MTWSRLWDSWPEPIRRLRRMVRPATAADGWFDRSAGSVPPGGGEVLNFRGGGVLGFFRAAAGSPRNAGAAALRGVAAAGGGVALLEGGGGGDGLPPLPFGVALHLGEML